MQPKRQVAVHHRQHDAAETVSRAEREDGRWKPIAGAVELVEGVLLQLATWPHAGV